MHKPFLGAGTCQVPNAPGLRMVTTLESDGRLFLIVYGNRVAAAGAVAASPEAALRLWEVLVRLRHGPAADDRPAGPDEFGERIWAELTSFDAVVLPCAVGARVRKLVPEILRASIRHELESAAARAGTCLAELN